jgi:hypothetical protein
MLPKTAIVIVLSILLLTSCQSAQPVATSTASKPIPTTLHGVVSDFLVTERPRVIVFYQPTSGFNRVVLDENAQGELKTRTVSQYNCPLVGPPLQKGDVLEVMGYIDPTSGNFTAEEIRIVSDGTRCEP